MAAKYIYRMDDIAPDMNWDWFWKYINMFKRYGVKPLLGIIPDNKDDNLCSKENNGMKISNGKNKSDFWQIMRNLQSEGVVEFATHGYRHLYVTNKEGILKKKYGFKPQSEFVGLSYEEQYGKIKSGQDILKREGITTDIWMAPSHSFDEITLKVLADMDFKAVTDGIALYPFEVGKLIFVPQQCWRPKYFPFGIITVCLHTNWSDYSLYQHVESHLKSGASFISFNDARRHKTGLFKQGANVVFKAYYPIRMSLNIRGRIAKLKNWVKGER